MKTKNSNRFITIVLTSLVTLSSSAFAVDRIKQDNLTNVDLAGSWDTLPTSPDVAVFDATYATTGVLTTTSLLDWAGIRIASPGGKVIIDSAAGFNVGLGASGINMSAATRDLSIERFQFNASQTWNVASGQAFTLGRSTAPRVGVFVNNAAASTITKTGAGTVNLDMGNVTLGNVNWDVQAGTIRAIWNSPNAFGSGTITLGGGGIASGTPFTESVGNWTWNNAIVLTAATDSFIDNQNIAGVDRSLILSGNITGDGSLTFRNTGTMPDPGFLFTLSGTNGYTGGTTVTGGTVLFGSAAAVPASGTITVNGNGAVGGAAFATVQAWLDSGKIATASTGAVVISANSANAIDFSTGGYNSLALAAAGGFTYSGTLTPGSGGYIFGGGKNLTVTSALPAATTLTKNGNATTIISSDSNGYSGATTVNSGELQALATTAAGAKSTLGAGVITVNPAATLRFKTGGTTNAQSYANAINLSGATLISEDGIVTYGGAVGLTGANTINVVYSNKSATLSSSVTGSGSFTKTGPGPLVLNAAGSNIASLTVNQGKISVGPAASLTVVGQYRPSATSSKGTLDIAAGGVVNADSLFSSWGTDMLVDGALNVTGIFTFSGGTSTVTGSGTIKAATLAHANFGTDNLNGARFNLGAGGITFTQPGALNLGATTLGAFADWSSIAPMALTAVTTVNTLDSVDGTTPRTIALTGVLSGVGGLTKTGAGTLTLNAANIYTGATAVSTGTLALLGGSQKSPITVDSGATLGFTVGSPTTSISTVTFSGATAKVSVSGTPAAGILMTASNITGTPVLDPAIPGYALVIQNSGTELALNAIGGANYNSWATTNGVSGQAANLDHDNDGVSNGVEYFIGGNTVTTGFTPLPGVTITAGVRSITWTKAATYTGTYGTDFFVETSTTLAGAWTVETLGGNVSISGDNVTYTFPAGPVKNFARLKVTGP